jgi:tRNA-Thr(GGU) m(6)t(6)A37 methyltransferase TsaA
MERIGKCEVRFIGIVEKTEERRAEVRVFPEYCDGLKGVEYYSHLIILYWIHLRDSIEDRKTLLVYPKRHTVKVETGVFACRSPSRPNPIGLCVVRLVKKGNCTLTLDGLDAFEGSPIIDIKPYVPEIDSVTNARVPEWSNNK